MMLFKACPKCHGDLQVQADTFGKYVACMQCGFLKDLDLPKAGPAEARKEERELAAAAPKRKAA